MKVDQMTITHMDINKIIPYARNPRNNAKAIDAVAASLKEYGFRQPIVVDVDNVVVVGHTRLLAAKKLGMTEVPVHVADGLTEQQIKAYRIADNKTNEFAEWDMELLRLELEETADLFTGWAEDELVEDTGVKKGKTDPDDVPDTPPNPISRPGDIWILGDHKLICGDSTKPETYQQLLDGEIADMVWTDPPYNVGYVSPNQKRKERAGDKTGTHHTIIANDKMDSNNFADFLNDAFAAAFPNLKPGGSVYISYSDKESIAFKQALLNNDILVKSNLIWIKNHLMLSMLDYHPIHEPILYGWKEGAAHYFVDDRTKVNVIDDAADIDKMTKDQLVELIKKIKTDAVRFDRTAHNDLHPTMKPVDLLQELIGNSSRPQEIVLDFFGGSGSTLIACEGLGRKARLIELETKYVDVIINRWEEHTGRKATLNGKTYTEVKAEREV